jgi:hypothetical protein
LPLHHYSSAPPGAYAFGTTLNLVACGIGRSIEGAIFGGVVGIELYKVVAAPKRRRRLTNDPTHHALLYIAVRSAVGGVLSVKSSRPER